MATAFFIDGAFFLKRFPKVYTDHTRTNPKDARVVANTLMKMCQDHLSHTTSGKESNQELYRIFFYDCPPLNKKVHLPISKKCLNFEKCELYTFKSQLFDELKKKRKVALRMGRLQDFGEWVLKPDRLKDLLNKRKNFEDLTDDDFEYSMRQKQIDMKIAIDIASVSYKKQVSQIILIAGDADFVPAAKLARREGIDFILDPMYKPISPDLFEHIDGLQSKCPAPKKNSMTKKKIKNKSSPVKKNKLIPAD